MIVNLRRVSPDKECVHAERILLCCSSLSVCNEEGIWLHKTSLPKTCMLSCLPESCWSACLTLVVSGSLCAELITGCSKSVGDQIGLLDRLRFWGGGGNFNTLIDFNAII